MQLATVKIRGVEKLAICFDGRVFDVKRLWEMLGEGLFKIDMGFVRDAPAFTMMDYLRGGQKAHDDMRWFHDLIDGVWRRGQKTALFGAVHREEDVTFLCPVPRPPMLIHLGENYPRMYRQAPLGTSIPACPPYDAVSGYIAAAHMDPLMIPDQSESFGGHGEIGCVVGVGGRDIEIKDARKHIAGFLCVLDFHGGGDEMAEALGYEATRVEKLALVQLIRMRTRSQPMGPYLTTPEAVGDPYDCMVQMKLNDEPVARYWTAVVAAGFERTISHLSHIAPVLPGTIIQLGMMSSFSISFEGKQDVPRNASFGVDIERVGYLRSPIVLEGREDG
jgi:2-keto-4-pentenoate hydratase/2-oxohepta-3-ene-1,7-dioic acid hydratase in catechol pathway